MRTAICNSFNYTGARSISTSDVTMNDLLLQSLLDTVPGCGEQRSRRLDIMHEILRNRDYCNDGDWSLHNKRQTALDLLTLVARSARRNHSSYHDDDEDSYHYAPPRRQVGHQYPVRRSSERVLPVIYAPERIVAETLQPTMMSLVKDVRANSTPPPTLPQTTKTSMAAPETLDEENAQLLDAIKLSTISVSTVAQPTSVDEEEAQLIEAVKLSTIACDGGDIIMPVIKEPLPWNVAITQFLRYHLLAPLNPSSPPPQLPKLSTAATTAASSAATYPDENSNQQPPKDPAYVILDYFDNLESFEDDFVSKGEYAVVFAGIAEILSQYGWDFTPGKVTRHVGFRRKVVHAALHQDLASFVFNCFLITQIPDNV